MSKTLFPTVLLLTLAGCQSARTSSGDASATTAEAARAAVASYV